MAGVQQLLTCLLLPSILPFLVATLPLVTGRSIPPALTPRHHSASTNPLTSLTIPSSSLPAPASNLTLYAVALGLGTQNYSCVAASSASDEPSAVGALASLYDISAILENDLIGETMEMALPGLALGVWGMLGGSGSGGAKQRQRQKKERKDKRAFGGGSTEERAQQCDRAWSNVVSNLPLPSTTTGSISSSASLRLPQPMGHHFFSAAGVPSWLLSLSYLPSSSGSQTKSTSSSGAGDGTVLFQGAKAASASAPADASKGFDGEGAVAWLYLTRTAEEIADDDDDDDKTTAGIEAVYRVVTAGGSPPDTCEGWEGEEKEVAYAAEYWFYGR